MRRRVAIWACLLAILAPLLIVPPAQAATKWTGALCTTGYTDVRVTVCSQVQYVTSNGLRDYRNVYIWWYPSSAAYNADNVTVGGWWSGHNHPNYHVRSVSAPYTSSIHCTVRGRLDGFLTWGYSFAHYHHCW